MFRRLYAVPKVIDILAALKLSQDAIRQLLFYLEQNLKNLTVFLLSILHCRNASET